MELITYNKDKYDKVESKFYTFFLDKNIKNEIKATLPKEADDRRNKIIENFKMSYNTLDWPKVSYFVQLTDSNESGRAFSNIIKCYINNDFLKVLPMAHEESHLITYNIWGALPVFWSEGLAEYSTAMLLGHKNIFSQNYIRDIMGHLNVQSTTELILTTDKNMFYSSVRRSEFCLALAGCFIYYMIYCCEYGVFLRIIELIKGRNFRDVYDYFESNHFVLNWQRWYEYNYGL